MANGKDQEWKAKRLLESLGWTVLRGGTGPDLFAVRAAPDGRTECYVVEVKSTRDPARYYVATDELGQFKALRALSVKGIPVALLVRRKTGPVSGRWRAHAVGHTGEDARRRRFSHTDGADPRVFFA